MSEKNLNYGDGFLSQSEADNIKNLKTIDSKVIKDYQVFYKDYTKDEIKTIQRGIGIKNADGIIGKNTIMAILSWQNSIGIKENGLVHKSYLPKLKAKYEEKISTQNNSKKERQTLNNDVKLNLLKNQTNDIIKSQNDLIKQYKEDTGLGVKWIDNVFGGQQVLRNYESMFENGKDRAKKLKTKIEEELKTNSSLNNSEKNALNNLIGKLNELINAKFEGTNIFSMAKVSWENRGETVYNGVEGGKGLANGVKESVLGIYEFTKLLVNFSTSYFKGKEGAEYREKVWSQATDLFETIDHLDKEVIIEGLKKTFDHISGLSGGEKAYAIGNIAGILIGFLLPIKGVKGLDKLEDLAKQNALKNGVNLSTKMQQTAISIGKYILNGPAEQVLGNALSQSLRGSISIIQSKNSLKVKINEIDNTIKLLEEEIGKTKDLAKKEELNKVLLSFKDEKIKLVGKPKNTNQASPKDKKAANDEVYKTTETKTQVAANDEYYEVKKVANGGEIVVVNNNSVKVREKGNKFIEPKDNNKTKSEKTNISENEIFTLENFPKEKYLELAKFLEKNLTKSKLVNTHLSAIIEGLKNGNITQKDLAFKINFIKSSNPHIDFKFLDDYLKNIGKNTEVPSKNTDFVIIKEEPKINNTKSKVASEEVLIANGRLSDAERIAKAAEILGLKRLTKEQKSALLRAHNLPQGENFKKGRILMSKGENGNPIFTREQAQKLMDEGIAGRYEASNNINTFDNVNILNLDISDGKKIFDTINIKYLKDMSDISIPNKKISIEGNDFYIGPKFTDLDGREFIVSYIKNGNNFEARLFYLSGSGGNWHIMPNTNENGYISKGRSLGLSYEKGTTVTPEMNAIFANLEVSVNNKNFDLSEFGKDANFNHTTLPNIDIDIDISGTIVHPDLKKQLQEVDKLGGDGRSIAEYKPKNQDELMRMYNTYKPFIDSIDKNSIEPLKPYKLKHPTLGKTNVVPYIMKVKSGDIIRIDFAHTLDQPDLIWIENIMYPNSGVNNFGMYNRPINAGSLTAKPFDYTEQALNGASKINGTPYSDQRTLLQTNPLIQIYKTELRGNKDYIQKVQTNTNISNNIQNNGTTNIVDTTSAKQIEFKQNENPKQTKNSETNVNGEKIETFGINKEDFEIISKLTLEQKEKILTELFQEISNLGNKIPKKELKKIRMKVHPDRVSDFEKNFNEINEILKKYNLERDLLKDFRNKTIKTENFDNFGEQKNNSKNYSENTKKSDMNNENNSGKNSENTNSSDKNTENNINTGKTEEVKLENNIKTEAELKDYLTKNYSEKLKTGIKLSIILATGHTIYAYAKNNNTNEIILTNDLNQEIKTEEIKYLLNTVSNKEYIGKIINSEFISDILNPKIEEIIAILKNPELRKIGGHTYVFALQSALSMIGFGKNLGNIDGWLGEKTISALKDFQVSVAEKYSISEKNFGKFEKITTESLINELNKLKNT